MNQVLFSAPNENYTKHIDICTQKLHSIFPIFQFAVARIFSINKSIDIQSSFLSMVKFHDLGKLTKRWQERLTEDWRPAHAPIGAAYIWNKYPFDNDDLKNALSFAVAIHHTDKGLLGDNIEKPDVQAILHGIIEESTGEIRWHESTSSLSENYFPKEVASLNIEDLKNMARGLRLWSRGDTLLEQQKRRLQVTLVHHILKLCDISASSEREEYKKKTRNEQFGGWIMVKEINEYVSNLEKRIKQ